MKIEMLTVGSLGTNCYILCDESLKNAIVVDPGGSFEKIKSKINELGVCITHIVLTHAHFDHIEALDELKQITNAIVCIGKNEESSLGDSSKNLCMHFGGTSPDTKADLLLSDKSTLQLGGEKITIIETPGHTVGGISLYADGKLISGDTLFSESIGRSDFPGGNHAVLVNSIKEKLFILPENTVVYPGHGPSTTIEHEINNNPFVW